MQREPLHMRSPTVRAMLWLMVVVLCASPLCAVVAAQPDSQKQQQNDTKPAQGHPSANSILIPIQLRADGWYYTRVGSRTAPSAPVDPLIEDAVRQTFELHEATQEGWKPSWEGLGSGLILEGPPTYRTRQPRLEHAQCFLHAQWHMVGGVPQINRTWWTRYEPLSSHAGVVVLLPGMLATPEPIIEGLLLGLRAQGWTVLRMIAHPSRYTEDQLVLVTPQRDPMDIATEFARGVDTRIGGLVQSVKDVLVAHNQLTGPRVLIAMSGGTLASPALLASTGDVFDAAVLIGAGADLLSMSEQSNYAGFLGGLQLGWLGEPVNLLRRDDIVTAYRAIPSQDPFHQAPAVRINRMLMIQGSTDQAVPAALGEILWQRLGQPERWLAPAGHEVLFFGYLPMRSPDLLNWIGKSLPASESGRTR
jgi:hypothetical protein